MNELDEVWTQMMNQAIANAREAGRHDVAEYLTLKATNDFIRSTSVKWLFDSMLEIAAQYNRNRSSIKIENEDSHNFAFNRANMVGSRLMLRQGVRCLSIEAGWTRTPADGFMRGGALAAARIAHFGISNANEDLILLRENDLPQWFAIDKHERKTIFDSRNLQKHFQIFTS
jgi:hypothetical protein